jgi:hypothetical protein
VLVRLSLRIPWGRIPLPAALDRRPMSPRRTAKESAGEQGKPPGQ